MGSSRSTREARRLIRVENHDAVSRFFSMLFCRSVDPEPRCMLVEAVPIRTTGAGILRIYKHSETLWNLQLLEILRASAEICNLNYNAAISFATHLLCVHRDFGREHKVLRVETVHLSSPHRAVTSLLSDGIARTSPT